MPREVARSPFIDPPGQLHADDQHRAEEVGQILQLAMLLICGDGTIKEDQPRLFQNSRVSGEGNQMRSQRGFESSCDFERGSSSED